MEKNDFTVYEKNGDIYSIGIKFDNYLRKYNLPAMTGGGGDRGKHNKTHFSSLGLPIGLTLLDNQIDNTNIHGNLHDKVRTKSLEGGVIDNNLYTKLLELADQNKKTKSKTRKKQKKRRRKTRKL